LFVPAPVLVCCGLGGERVIAAPVIIVLLGRTALVVKVKYAGVESVSR
jgi:hypothetical protein